MSSLMQFGCCVRLMSFFFYKSIPAVVTKYGKYTLKHPLSHTCWLSPTRQWYHTSMQWFWKFFFSFWMVGVKGDMCGFTSTAHYIAIFYSILLFFCFLQRCPFIRMCIKTIWGCWKWFLSLLSLGTTKVNW